MAFGFLRRMAHEQPVVLYSCILGVAGPIMVLTVPKIRRQYFGFVPPETLPSTYPVPKGPRKALTGYDD